MGELKELAPPTESSSLGNDPSLYNFWWSSAILQKHVGPWPTLHPAYSVLTAGSVKCLPFDGFCGFRCITRYARVAINIIMYKMQF